MRRPVLFGWRSAIGLWLALAAAATTPAAAEVDVQAHVQRHSLAVGETTPLEVVVRGTLTGVRDPEFGVPDGLAVLSSGRSQSFSSVNGQVTVEVLFRYEIGANRAGRYDLGPIRVHVGKQMFESPSIAISVAAAARSVGALDGAAGASARLENVASLRVDVSPAEPYVGQPLVMRVRLIQRAPLAEDPSYVPPPTPGFWSERASQPESYYADEGGTRVLVTETRSRLYPLAAGSSSIGEAGATLRVAVPTGRSDPLQWFSGGAPRREVAVHSTPVAVRVRSLPPGAPAGFEGAVGGFDLCWKADRAETPEDVPVTVRLEVRGLGNLPLIHTPKLEAHGFEVFASAVEDSLAAAGSASPGTRRFQWTVLPRKQGRWTLPAPEFSWFDPEAGRYRSAELPAIEIEVMPPLAASAGDEEVFPAILAKHACDPFRRAGWPWAYGLAGIALGAAIRLWRRGARPPSDQVARAEQREWLHAVGRGTGTEFWGAADRAAAWLAERGVSIEALAAPIATARYGGSGGNVDVVRSRMVELLAQSVPPAAPRWRLKVLAGTMVIAAVLLAFLGSARGGLERARVRARGADQAARAGDVDRARAQWGALWREGARDPALAARLAWSELRAGSIGTAALWVLRADRGEPRDAAMDWVIGQIRETGGLVGFSRARLPVRSVEWAISALLLGFGVAWLWPRRPHALAAIGAFILCVGVFPVQGWLASMARRGVVGSSVPLEGAGLELEPGQVVTVLSHHGPRARATAGRGVEGWVPLAAIRMPEDRP